MYDRNVRTHVPLAQPRQSLFGIFQGLSAQRTQSGRIETAARIDWVERVAYENRRTQKLGERDGEIQRCQRMLRKIHRHKNCAELEYWHALQLIRLTGV